MFDHSAVRLLLSAQFLLLLYHILKTVLSFAFKTFKKKVHKMKLLYFVLVSKTVDSDFKKSQISTFSKFHSHFLLQK